MTTSYNHTSFPTQQLIYPPSAASQLIGLPIAGARVFTYSSQNHAIPKTTYQTNVGSPPPALPNPVVANAIGQVTIYWALDDSDITDLYYVEIKGATGDDTIYYSYDNFDGAAIIGGVAPTEVIDFNLVRNPQFTFNRFKPYPATYVLTNENHSVDDGVYVADDWKFSKSNASAIENIAITPFTLGQPTVPHNPVNYLSWNIDTAGSAETYKKIFQEYESVQTLSGYAVTFQFWASSIGNSQITIDFRQYFGSGGGSADVVTAYSSNPIILSPTWTQYTGTITIPSVVGKSLGTGGDDKLMFEINFPLNATSAANVDITNVQIEFGTTANEFQYETPNDQKARLDEDWFVVPTGTIKDGVMLPAQVTGWIALNDGTVGNVASAATTYASEDAYALYALLWGNVTNINCPVSTGRGASALADFNANKTIRLPLSADRFNLNIGALASATYLGFTGGSFTSNALLAHTHNVGGAGNVATSSGTFGTGANSVGGGVDNIAQTAGTITNVTATASAGSGASFDLTNPYTYFYRYIKL